MTRSKNFRGYCEPASKKPKNHPRGSSRSNSTIVAASPSVTRRTCFEIGRVRLLPNRSAEEHADFGSAGASPSQSPDFSMKFPNTFLGREAPLHPPTLRFNEMKVSAIVCVAVFFLCSNCVALEPWAENRWYWSHNGKPVMLLGGSDDDNLFQWPAEKLIPQLDRIAAAGGNVIRNTMSDRKDSGFEIYPFLQLESGKYDLTQWNPIYWQRFDQLLSETANAGSSCRSRFGTASITAMTQRTVRNRWQNHPYCPQNNVNYTFSTSPVSRSRYPDHPGANKQPFFFTTPKQRNNTHRAAVPTDVSSTSCWSIH